MGAALNYTAPQLQAVGEAGRTTRGFRTGSSRLRKKESRGAKPLWQGNGGVPQICFHPHSWPGMGIGGWSKESSITLLAGSEEEL